MKMTGRVDPEASRPTPQPNSGEPTKVDVQKKAIDLRCRAPRSRNASADPKSYRIKAVRIQQKSDGIECAWIIVDDCDHFSPR